MCVVKKLDATTNGNFTVLQATNHQNETWETLRFGRVQNPESRTGNRPGAKEDPAGTSSVPPSQGLLWYIHSENTVVLTRKDVRTFLKLKNLWKMSQFSFFCCPQLDVRRTARYPLWRYRLGFSSPRERDCSERSLPPVPAVGQLLSPFRWVFQYLGVCLSDSSRKPVFSLVPVSSRSDVFAVCFRSRPLAPERQCGENVEISEELHHHQGTFDRRRVGRPRWESKPVIVSVLSPVRTSCSATRPTSFECFACWLNTSQVGWKTSRLCPCMIVWRGNTQVLSLSHVRRSKHPSEPSTHLKHMENDQHLKDSVCPVFGFEPVRQDKTKFKKKLCLVLEVRH